MKNIFWKRVVVAFILVGVFLFVQVPAQALQVSYNLQFFNFFDGYGSGMATFDDTSVGFGLMYPSATLYNFTSFVGSGAGGNWTTSTFEYDPVTGDSRWEFKTDGVWIGASFPDVGVGLTAIAALEENFDFVADGGNLVWQRTSSPVPEPATMLLLGSGLLGLAGYGRKRLLRK